MEATKPLSAELDESLLDTVTGGMDAERLPFTDLVVNMITKDNEVMPMVPPDAHMDK